MIRFGHVNESERWLLLADVSNSTHFFWELMEAGKQKPDALFQSSAVYSAHMDSIFGDMANLCSDRLLAHLGNTMGDGFILIGRHGHGADHIRSDAPRVLELARMVKRHSDEVLLAATDRIVALLDDNDVPCELPNLRMNVTLHHGYVVTMMQSQRFFGDTVNYCARVATAAFQQWHEGVVLTAPFFDILPQELQQDIDKAAVVIRYPAREWTTHYAYRLAMSNAAIWSKIEELAGPA